MQLTQKYFDKGVANILDKMTNMESGIRADMVTKKELKAQLDAQTTELKDYVHQGFETQQVWIDERFGELITVYDVRDRVEKLEKDFRHFKLRKSA